MFTLFCFLWPRLHFADRPSVHSCPVKMVTENVTHDHFPRRSPEWKFSKRSFRVKYLLSGKMFKLVISEYDLVRRASFATCLENQYVKLVNGSPQA